MWLAVLVLPLLSGGGAAAEHTCAVVNAKSQTIHLPIAGADCCSTILEHCGGGRDGALCARAALKQLLPSDAAVAAVRGSMRTGSRLYFLCAPLAPSLFRIRAERRPQLERLNQMLQNATDAADAAAEGSAAWNPVDRGSASLRRYQAAARWSTLGAEGWTAAEKAAHFLFALKLHAGSYIRKDPCC